MFLEVGGRATECVYRDFVRACEDYIGLKEKADLHELNSDKLLQHNDGFGYAFIQNDHFVICKNKAAIAKIRPIETWMRINSSILLIHARKASPGLKLGLENNHPFYWCDTGVEYIFAHNGTIKNEIKSYNKDIFYPIGSTDSERYFYVILSKIYAEKQKITSKMISEIIESWDFTGCNFILADKKAAYVGVFYRETPKYYTMKLYETDKSMIVSSAYLPSLSKPVRLLKNGTLIKIDLASRIIEDI
ncbi:MAG: class II glutamine amidotransferase [Candidatus Heimdallarchaeaceae archaeon]